MENKLVTCNKCGWIHFEVYREQAEYQVQIFNEYYNSLTFDKKKSYFNNQPASITTYEHCFICNESYKNFKDTEDSSKADGHTINPIINRRE